MKFAYPGSKKEELIKEYKLLDGKIVVNYLDGNTEELPLDKEQEIYEKMIKQAQQRKNSKALFVAKCRSKKQFSLTVMICELSALGTLITITSPSIISKLIGIMMITPCSFLGFSKEDYEKIREQIRELSKYNIYLSIKDSIENEQKNGNNGDLFKKINNTEENLNINTLDNYSLKEIKRIRQNLKNIQKSKNEDNFTLKKVI